MNTSNQVGERRHNGPTNPTDQQGGNALYDASDQGREVSPAAPRSHNEAATTIVPPVDIYEDETGFTVIADLPGVSKDRLGVRVTGDSLVIEGTASAPVTGNMELLYGEAQNPVYRRSFTLSRELDPGKIEAKLANGVLRLHIPKTDEAKPRRINVNVA